VNGNTRKINLSRLRARTPRMNLPRWAVEHPFLTVMLSLAMIGAGLYALATTPVELNPYVESPVVGIEISYPGMSAQDMARFFAEPIEKAVGIVKGVQNIRSTSQDGHTEIALIFPYGTDMKRALTETQSLVNSFLNQIPQNLANATIPWVVHVDQSNIPIIDFALSRPGWDPVRLREFADNTLRDKFERIPGAQSVIVFGGERRQIQVVVDRTKLAAYGLSILDVKQHLDMFSVSQGAGELKSPQGNWLVHMNYAVTQQNVADLANLPIGMTPQGVVYLRDVATVRDGVAEVTSAYHYDGKSRILLSVIKTPPAPAPAVIRQALALAHKFEADYPGLRIRIAYNQNDFISTIVRNAGREILLGLLVTNLVVVLFLRDLRATAVVFVTLPLSILFGLFLFRPVGLTISTPTLMGFTFVIGRLVDDSVILLDVVHRHLKLGKPPKQAAIDGASEVMTALISTSLSFWAALLPLNFLGGPLGTGFRGMTAPMILANIGSTFLALSLNPMMAAYLFKPEGDARVGLAQRVTNWVAAPLQWFLGRLERLYHRVLVLSIDYRFAAVAVGVVSILVAVEIYKDLPQEMMPQQDTGIGIGGMAAWPGTPFPEFERMVSRVEKIILAQRDTNGKPVTEKISTMIGAEPQAATYFTGYGMQTPSIAGFKISFVDKDHRHINIWQIENRIAAEAKRQVPGIRYIWFKEFGATPVATARAEIQANLTGPSLRNVYALGQRLGAIAQQVPGPNMIYTNMCWCEPQLNLVIDQTRAAELRIPPRLIAAQAYYALQGGMTEQFFHPENALLQSRILIRYKKSQRVSPQDLGDTMITLPGGGEVPLKELARIQETYAPDYVVRKNYAYQYTVFAGYGALGLKQTMQNIVMGGRMQLFPLPQGYTITPSGLMPSMLDSLDRLNTGLKLSLAIIFFYLLLQYGSLAMSIVMMTAIPLEAFGAMIFLQLRHMKYSPPVLWGLVVLTGIVLSNAILLIDKAMKNEKAGMTPREAILEAGPTRLRPILMTALATMAAWIPFMYWPPAGADRYTPIATGMVGGLFTNIFMTLVIVPAVYVLVHDTMAFLRRAYLPAPAAVPEATPGEAEAGRTAAAPPAVAVSIGGGSNGTNGGGEGEEA
jgi:multidrug efflux pump subunit AcrB